MQNNKNVGQILFTGITVNDLLEWIGQIMDSKIGNLPTKNLDKQSDYITRAEASRVLKVSLPTLHDWTKQGLLKSYKMGSRVLYKESEVIGALEQVPTFKHKKGGYQHA